MRVRTVCILGGTGFVGKHLVNRLAEHKIQMRVLTRHRERHRQLLVFPTLQLIEADPYDEQCLRDHFEDCDAVVNLVGILNGSREALQRTHTELPEKIARICRETGVKRLLHLSALGAAEDGRSLYQQSKGLGERRVLEANSERLLTTCYRPSVIFGDEDDFLNRFARLLRISPGFFPLPTPNTRFAPVYVGDVAEALVRTLEDKDAAGKALQLCGPRSYTLRELVAYTAEQTGHHRYLIGLGDSASALQGRILGMLPGQPYSYDNYLSSCSDSVCSDNALPKLNIHPKAVEAVAPGYLAALSARRQYNVFRQRARRD